MDNKENKLDELLKGAMQFAADEIPEPDARIQVKLRKMVKRKKVYKNPFIQLLNTDIKLYHALAVVMSVLIIHVALRPAVVPQQGTISTNSGSSDTAAAFKSSSLKNDTFLVRNFITNTY